MPKHLITTTTIALFAILLAGCEQKAPESSQTETAAIGQWRPYQVFTLKLGS